jgi:hypothetical protein
VIIPPGRRARDWWSAASQPPSFSSRQHPHRRGHEHGPSIPFADLLSVLRRGTSAGCSSRRNSGRWTGSDGCRLSAHDGLAIARDTEGRIGRTCWQNLQASERLPDPSRASGDDGAFLFPPRTAVFPGPDGSLGHFWSGLEQSLATKRAAFLFHLAHCRASQHAR